MNLQLGIYEIFSAIIPGCIYLVAIGQILKITNIVSLNWKSFENSSPYLVIIFLAASYLLGIAFSRMALWWYKLFKGRNTSKESIRYFSSTHKDRWDINIKDEDWLILLSLIRSRNFDLARENERHLASSIMLRNVSFGFVVLALINMIQGIVIYNLFYLSVGIGFLVLSILMIGESTKFRRWYYDSILSTILAYRLDLEKLVVTKKQDNIRREKKSV